MARHSLRFISALLRPLASESLRSQAKRGLDRCMHVPNGCGEAEHSKSCYARLATKKRQEGSPMVGTASSQRASCPINSAKIHTDAAQTHTQTPIHTHLTGRITRRFLLRGHVPPFRTFSAAAAGSSVSSSPTPPPKSRLTWQRVLTGTVLGSLIATGAYLGTLDEASISAWSFEASKYANPLFRLLDPEEAHKLAIKAAAHSLVPRETRPDPPVLHLELWGRSFSNPIGLAAGFDKHAVAVEGLLGIGFGFIEVGSVTPLPQEGNPKPRVFRLPDQGAVINRYGFNSDGIMAVTKRLGAQHGKRRLAESVPASSWIQGDQTKPAGRASSGLLGVNLGKNKSTEDAASDYVQGVHTLSQYADYLVINVSSPNTPGLRKLQGRKQLKDLVKKVLAARDEMQWGEKGPPPLLVKIAPDLSKQDLADIAAVALTLRLDGLIISNTTISRPDSILGAPHAEECGGLSGKPLFNLSTVVLRDMYQLTRGKIPLIGCGGIFSGEDAYMKIRSGASLVQLYTAFAYEGPALVPRLKEELAACLERDGFKSIKEAVGVDCR